MEFEGLQGISSNFMRFWIGRDVKVISKYFKQFQVISRYFKGFQGISMDFKGFEGISRVYNLHYFTQICTTLDIIISMHAYTHLLVSHTCSIPRSSNLESIGTLKTSNVAKTFLDHKTLKYGKF